ncbi:SPARC-like protein 1 [Serinus canaria]|uniref:SPARC-like protein 1 n=1 Tax=Serinus canaria TaxID=9135 RepID=UPI0021CC6F73|nr:SPARC-like protein 1 [Serinus canaria]
MSPFSLELEKGEPVQIRCLEAPSPPESGFRYPEKTRLLSSARWGMRSLRLCSPHRPPRRPRLRLPRRWRGLRLRVTKRNHHRSRPRQPPRRLRSAWIPPRAFWAVPRLPLRGELRQGKGIPACPSVAGCGSTADCRLSPSACLQTQCFSQVDPGLVRGFPLGVGMPDSPCVPQRRGGAPWQGSQVTPDSQRDVLSSDKSTGSKLQVKTSLKSINFLALHNKLGLASDNQDSDSGSSGREQSSSEHDQLRKHEEHGNTENQHLPGHAEHPVGAFSFHHEHNMWKYNKNAVGLSKKTSESDDEESMEEEDEKWGEETDYRDTKHKDHQTCQGDLYKRQQHENSMQLDELLRDSSHLTWKNKRHSKKFDLEEEQRENRKKSYKEEIPLSQKTRNEYQDGKQQSQERKYPIQLNYQSDHDTVVKIQDREDSNDDDSHDSGDIDGEEYLSSTWKETASEEEERTQSNDQERTSTKPEGEGTTEDDTAVHRETEDYQIVKIKDLAHSEQDYYDHEPPNSDNKQQLKMSSSTENMNSMDSEDKVNYL